MTTSAMQLLSIAVLKEKIEEVVSHLLELGIFHPVDIRHIEEELSSLSPFQIEKEYTEYEALEARLSDIARKTGVSFPPEKDAQPFSYEHIDKTLHEIEKKLTPLITERDELEVELNTKEAMLSQIKEYVPFSLPTASSSTFLKVELGKIEEKNAVVLERSLSNIPHVIYPFKKEGKKIIVLLIGLRRDRVLLEKVLKDLAWEKVDSSQEPQELSREASEKIMAEIGDYAHKIGDAKNAIRSLGEQSQGELSKARFFVSLKKSLLEAKRYSCTTNKTVLISGWVPEEDKARLIEEVKKVDSASYIEARDAGELNIPKEEIPVRLKHTTLFKPFELLIEAYGIPRYGTIDPTVFVAISFLIMFGAMFGDVGQGLILSLVSLLLWKSKKEKVKQAATLLFYCSISSEVFGMLYGEFFGFEFKSLWIKPINNILELFAVCIFFGVLMMTAGIILNIINALRDKDYIKVLFDKAGLIAGIIYWAGIAAVAKIFVLKAPLSPVYGIVIISAMALLLVKPFIEIIGKKKKENFFTAFMESIIDILEIVMGYLANTVSFIRIAAFALAHTGLFLSVFELSRLLKDTGGGVPSFLVLVLGNVFIILLEGLIVSIQSLRLNYYEFFSKFFVSGKYVYKPLTL